MDGKGWVRASAREKCPVCEHDSHCTWSPDKKIVRCKRSKSDEQVEGKDGWAWLHRFGDAIRPASTAKVHKNGVDWGPKQAGFVSDLTPELCGELAGNLGVDSVALVDLGYGWNGSKWTTPMRDATGAICGIKTRDRSGDKKAIDGSKLGVFRRAVPTDATDGFLLICEGESDTAAALSYGFDAIGVSGAGNAATTAAVYAKGRDVVIFADRDEKGEDGAVALQKACKPVAGSIRTVRPPEGWKDLRAWRQSGASKEDVDALIAATRPEATGLRMRGWREVATDQPVAWLINGLVPVGGLVVLAGQPGSGKTLLMLDAALRCACGMTWLGRPCRPMSTLHLAGEGSRGLAARLRAWSAANSQAQEVEGHFVSITEGVPDLTKPTALLELELLSDRAKATYGRAPNHIVIDTLAMAAPGCDENDSASMGLVLAVLAQARIKLGVTTTLLHHMRKQQNGVPASLNIDSLRGSSSIGAAADVVLFAKTDGDAHLLRMEKARDGEILQAIRYRIIGQDTGMALEDGRNESGPIITMAEEVPAETGDSEIARVVDALVDLVSATRIDTIVRKAGMKTGAGRAAVDRAMSAGLIAAEGSGKRLVYRVPIAPQRAPTETESE